MMNRYSPYDGVAAEYYDPTLHPTCANFRELGLKFAEDLLSVREFHSALISGGVLETGCGKSTLMEVLDKSDGGPHQIFLQDASESMLNHSIRWQNQVNDLVICDASGLNGSNESDWGFPIML